MSGFSDGWAAAWAVRRYVSTAHALLVFGVAKMAKDGTIESNGSKKQPVCTVTLHKGPTAPESVFEFRFHNEDQNSLTFQSSEFPEDIQDKFLLFGVRTKIQNFYAGAKGDAQEAYENAQKGVEALKDGKWSTRQPAKPKGFNLQLVHQACKEAIPAIYKALGKPKLAADELELKAAGYSASQESAKTPMGNKRIRQVYERLVAESAVETVSDSDI